MPALRDEPADSLSPLRKQLILSQVQILELEDVRDELKSAVEDRDRVLTALQALADRTLAETQKVQADAKQAGQTLAAVQEDRKRLQTAVENLERAALAFEQRLTASENASGLAEAQTKEKAARLETLENEIRAMKSTRSWRWTAPLRSLARLFR